MLTFKPHIHPAVIGEDLVLLDAQDGQYLCLRDAASGLGHDPSQWEIEDPQLGELLTDAGLVEQGVRGRLATRSPQSDWSQTVPARLPITVGMTACIGAAVAFHTAHFSALLERAARARLNAARDEVAAMALSSRFMRLRPWLPLQGLCLQRSFVQLAFLANAGVAVDWVFGVKTWPFEAHCWLQSGPIVLNDFWERTALYEPILVA